MGLIGGSRTVLLLVATAFTAVVMYNMFLSKPDFSHSRALRIYAAGSGEDMMSQPETAAEIIELSGKPAPHVLYLGTATYDDPKSRHHQTIRFVEKGCTIEPLELADTSPSAPELDAAFERANVILVSGGNTLYAVDRWRALGVDKRIAAAAAMGVVLAGGSAGGIVWFDGGHSDSMDPTTYRHPPGPMLRRDLSKKELSKSWAYIRVPGLGALHGLFCPHYDKVEGNGQLRAQSFESMMKMHSGETGICVDNWAALVINGESLQVVSRHGKGGSVGASGKYTDTRASGSPGAFIVRVDSRGKQTRQVLPQRCHVSCLGGPPSYVVESPMIPVARMQNPIPPE